MKNKHSLIVNSQLSIVNSSKGFSLLEVLVAIAIIGIAFTAVIKLQSQSIMMSRATQFYTSAPLLAQYKLADIDAGDSEMIEGEGGFGEDFPQYKWTITIDEERECIEKNADNSGLRKINLLVTDGIFKYNVSKYKFIPPK